MRVRIVQWRAILLPAGVAIGAILVLAWYNFLWIPAQQRYLNERNLRVLRTISAQIKSKVDNFDQAIDHAIDSTENPDKESLGAYVRLFAPDLEILQFAKGGAKGLPDAMKAASDSERLLFDQAGDPPRVALQHDEGTNFLYLGYQHASTRVVARANIEEVAAAYLPVPNDFDALLLADRDGRVIVQRSSMGIELARVDRLIARAPSVPASGSTAGDSNTPDAKTTSGAASVNSFQSLRVVTSVADVILGDASFRLYVQPIQLSLLSVPQEQQAGPANGKSSPRTSVQDEPEEWALCGLVRADHFASASSTISYSAPLLFGTLLACVCLGVPLLKLHVLNPRERLRRSDGVWVSVATFLLTALVTFAVLDAHQFLFAARKSTDDQLQKTADEIAESLSDEVRQIGLQMNELQQDPIWHAKTLNYHQDNLRFYRDELRDGRRDLPKILTGGEDPRCDPPWACRDALLAKLEGAGIPLIYPYFDLNAWSDRDGRQRIKWATGRRVTPFLDLAAANLPDFQAMKRAQFRQF